MDLIISTTDVCSFATGDLSEVERIQQNVSRLQVEMADLEDDLAQVSLGDLLKYLTLVSGCCVLTDVPNLNPFIKVSMHLE